MGAGESKLSTENFVFNREEGDSKLKSRQYGKEMLDHLKEYLKFKKSFKDARFGEIQLLKNSLDIILFRKKFNFPSSTALNARILIWELRNNMDHPNIIKMVGYNQYIDLFTSSHILQIYMRFPTNDLSN